MGSLACVSRLGQVRAQTVCAIHVAAPYSHVAGVAGVHQPHILSVAGVQHDRGCERWIRVADQTRGQAEDGVRREARGGQVALDQERRHSRAQGKAAGTDEGRLVHREVRLEGGRIRGGLMGIVEAGLE